MLPERAEVSARPAGPREVLSADLAGSEQEVIDLLQALQAISADLLSRRVVGS
jgi:hypothetical protein